MKIHYTTVAADQRFELSERNVSLYRNSFMAVLYSKYPEEEICEYIYQGHILCTLYCTVYSMYNVLYGTVCTVQCNVVELEPMESR